MDDDQPMLGGVAGAYRLTRQYGVIGDPNDEDALYAQELGKAAENQHRSPTPGCRCRKCEGCAPATLSVVTLPPSNVVSIEDYCDDSMTCACRKCSTDRSGLRPQGEGSASPFKAAA